MTDPSDIDPPSSLGPIAMSVPVPSVKPRVSTLRRRLLLAAAIVTMLGGVAFTVMGFVRTTSMDVPWGNLRIGFYQNGAPERWTCPQGHDHWSAPYWAGAVCLLLVSALLGLRARASYITVTRTG